MKLLFGFCFLFLSIVASSQHILKGVVLDAEKNSPVPNASVFLNATSVGTTTDEQGKFSLPIPHGRYELIVSSIGYETYTQIINAGELSDFITIRLKTKSEILEEVTIEPYEKSGWEKWGRFFFGEFYRRFGQCFGLQDQKPAGPSLPLFKKEQ